MLQNNLNLWLWYRKKKLDNQISLYFGTFTCMVTSLSTECDVIHMCSCKSMIFWNLLRSLSTACICIWAHDLSCRRPHFLWQKNKRSNFRTFLFLADTQNLIMPTAKVFDHWNSPTASAALCRPVRSCCAIGTQPCLFCLLHVWYHHVFMCSVWPSRGRFFHGVSWENRNKNKVLSACGGILCPSHGWIRPLLVRLAVSPRKQPSFTHGFWKQKHSDQGNICIANELCLKQIFLRPEPVMVSSHMYL